VEQTRRMLRENRIAGVAFGGRAGWRVSRESVARELRRRAAMAAAVSTVAEVKSAHGID